MNVSKRCLCVVVCMTGRQMGYRLMSKALHLKYGIKIAREFTMRILRARDPVGVSQCRRHVLRRRTYTALGPNYLWHADGHDKLKRFGFAIHACIDGYSRRVIWVNCASSNNDPSIIAYYYLRSVKQIGGCPFMMRTDCGTENVIAATMQCALRKTIRGHTYGPSPHNQRIESWWSYLRRLRLQWWTDFFSDLEEAQILNVDHEDDVDCLRFCFMNIIRRDLEEVKQLWNNHRIRESRGACCPGGVPDHLYYTPGNGALQCLTCISGESCDLLMHECNPPQCCRNQELEEHLKHVCADNALSNPCNQSEAVNLFQRLKTLLL